jgi:hypothetical protein
MMRGAAVYHDNRLINNHLELTVNLAPIAPGTPCSWWARSTTFARLTSVSTPSRRQRQPWRLGLPTIAGRCTNCCHGTYRRRVGHHPSNVGGPRICASVLLSGGVETTISCRAINHAGGIDKGIFIAEIVRRKACFCLRIGESELYGFFEMAYVGDGNLQTVLGGLNRGKLKCCSNGAM